MKKRVGILGVLIAIVLIGIGYAAITAVNLTINGNGTISPDDDNFKVVYTAVAQTTVNPSTVSVTTDTIDASTGVTTTSFTISNMTKKDDTVTLTYTIENKSEDYKAILSEDSTYLSVTGDTEYFQVTPGSFTQTTLNPGGTTTQTVTVTALKTPSDDDKSVTITLKLKAEAEE